MIKISGGRSVPVIVVCEQVMVGFDAGWLEQALNSMNNGRRSRPSCVGVCTYLAIRYLAAEIWCKNFRPRGTHLRERHDGSRTMFTS